MFARTSDFDLIDMTELGIADETARVGTADSFVCKSSSPVNTRPEGHENPRGYGTDRRGAGSGLEQVASDTDSQRYSQPICCILGVQT